MNTSTFVIVTNFYMETVVRISTITYGMFSLSCEKIPAEMKKQEKKAVKEFTQLKKPLRIHNKIVFYQIMRSNKDVMYEKENTQCGKR